MVFHYDWDNQDINNFNVYQGQLSEATTIDH